MRIQAVEGCSNLKGVVKPQTQGFNAHCSSQQQAEPANLHVRCSRQEVLTAVLQLAAGQQQSAVASVKHARAQSQHKTIADLCDAAVQATAGQRCMQV